MNNLPQHLADQVQKEAERLSKIAFPNDNEDECNLRMQNAWADGYLSYPSRNHIQPTCRWVKWPPKSEGWYFVKFGEKPEQRSFMAYRPEIKAQQVSHITHYLEELPTSEQTAGSQEGETIKKTKDLLDKIEGVLGHSLPAADEPYLPDTYQLAAICVSELISELIYHNPSIVFESRLAYWKDVLNEIKNQTP